MENLRKAASEWGNEKAFTISLEVDGTPRSLSFMLDGEAMSRNIEDFIAIHRPAELAFRNLKRKRMLRGRETSPEEILDLGRQQGKPATHGAVETIIRETLLDRQDRGNDAREKA